MQEIFQSMQQKLHSTDSLLKEKVTNIENLESYSTELNQKIQNLES